MADPKPRVKVPATAAPGEIIAIKAVLNHDMENGQRKDANGAIIPRHIINRFECRFDGEIVFHCDLQPSMAANPYFEFTMRAEKSGTMEFAWTEDGGAVFTASQPLTVG
jgi:sulfur-oxidizing protein SoxZ